MEKVQTSWDIDDKLTKQLLEENILTSQQIEEALEFQKEKEKEGKKMLLQEVLVHLDLISSTDFLKFASRNNIKLKIGQILLYNEVIKESQLEEALTLQKSNSDKNIWEILVEELEYVTKEQLVKLLAKQHNIIRIKPEISYVDPGFFYRFSEEDMLEYKFMPYTLNVDEESKTCLILIENTDLDDIERIEEIVMQSFENSKHKDKIVIEFAYATGIEIEKFIKIAIKQEDIIRLSKKIELETPIQRKDKSLEIWKEFFYTNELMNIFTGILKNAIDSGASDIHIEPMIDKFMVRFRIDGVLIHHADFPLALNKKFIRSVKSTLGFKDSYKRDIILDERQKIYYKDINSFFDLRISVIPNMYGDRLAIRVLCQEDKVRDFQELGMDKNIIKKYSLICNMSDGIVISAGPTGTGKTTTLHSTLNYLNREDINIMTVEDPVEYTVQGISQTTIWWKENIKYNDVIKATLRQDPDILMFGEMRDKESAQAALTAWLTGHLLFSTIHANDSVSAIVRLYDMWIKPVLLGSTLVSIVWQRLVRKVCNNCKEEYVLENGQLEYFNNYIKWFKDFIWKTDKKFSRWKWCECCNNTGYKWRVWVFELLCVNEEIKQAVINQETAGYIEEAARKNGMVSIVEDGVHKAMQGITTLDEILRVAAKLQVPNDRRTIEEIEYLLEGDISNHDIHKSIYTLREDVEELEKWENSEGGLEDVDTRTELLNLVRKNEKLQQIVKNLESEKWLLVKTICDKDKIIEILEEKK